MVNPNPRGPLRTMMGAFKVLINGDRSLQGDASLDDAVLDPPGDCIGCGHSSFGIINDNPVADEDLTIDLDWEVILGLAPPLYLPPDDVITKGLGVFGSTDTLGVIGKLLGPSL